ncbi:MAG: FAD-dependent oxidoreductase [Deltaproteobacteria bacterium]|nr:FAD-dependent oxidoreductase [Deltaproteobacteria bacterium]
MAVTDSTVQISPGSIHNGPSFRLSLTRPEQLAKLPPCQANCPGNGDIRGWVGIIAQREKLGLTLAEAYEKAWNAIVARNPFPATMGRVCPHPCEAGCNRNKKDGAVAINALERFVGDFALAERLPLPRDTAATYPESIGVIGSGPAGLSFAYQMARRGYPVTVYEKHAKPGGMLTYGIPEFRLPEMVIDAEIERILDAGVRLQLNTAVGREISVKELYDRHALVFLGIGAQKSHLLKIPGENGPGVWTGTTYLGLLNSGQPTELGRRVVVVGGGNTAIDAARAARRQGAEVTILYRRTRNEMPAIASEIDDALEENVRMEYLAAPVEILRKESILCGVRVQEMTLGEPDATGRRSPVPIADAVYEIPADAVIAAISQEPDWEGLEPIEEDGKRPRECRDAWLGTNLLAGGDVLGLGIASLAIGHGRMAAEAAHARLRGLPAPQPEERQPLSDVAIRTDYYASFPPASPPRRPAEERLANPDEEITGTLEEEQFQKETSRCFSCGLCFGCQHCLMYCNPRGYTRVIEPRHGAYFALDLDRCEGCGKCIELCPCGFLGPAADCCDAVR